MLFRENEEYKLMNFIATYDQYGESHEQYIANKEDIIPFQEAGHIDNLEIKEAVYDQDVLNRLNEVKHFPESEISTVSEYVFDNSVLEGTGLSAAKQIDLLEAGILELTALLVGGM